MSEKPGAEQTQNFKKTFLFRCYELEWNQGVFKKAFSLWYGITGIENDGVPFDRILEPAQWRDRRCLFSEKTGRGRGRPGSIWEFEAEVKHGERLSIYPSTGKCIGQWANQEDLAAWQAHYDAVREEMQSGGEIAKQIRQNVPMETLEPFRRAYHRLSGRQQGILLAQVLAHITGGPVKG